MVWLDDRFGPGDEMNAVDDDHDRVDPAEWQRPAMRAALFERDITTVYRLLQKVGFSQQRIAALSGQSQPEVSAIIHGRRVMAYDVLSRIADGLGIPRGYMGLSYAVEPGQGSPASTAPAVAGPGRAGAGGGAPSAGVAESEEDDPVQRRAFLVTAGLVAGGGQVPGIERWLPRPVGGPAGPLPPVPARIGAADIKQIRVSTHRLYKLDAQRGGGASLDAVTGYLQWASGLLRAGCSEDVGRQLRVALADVYMLAGTALLDSGRYRESNQHVMQGLVLARDVQDRELAASLLWQMGRVSLHREQVTDALRFFQFSRASAQAAGSHAELARLYANEAWAYALADQPELVAEALGRAEHEYGQVAAGQEPSTFHGAAHYLGTYSDDMPGYVAAAHWMLARGDDRSAARSADTAVDVTTGILAADNLPGRFLALSQTMHATALLRSGERERGLTAAHTAVDRVAAIRSVRAADRLRYLAEAAKAWPRHPAAIELRRRIANLRAA
jgi:antitoxin component HigA of HigAB toxin-antitoxin module